MKFVLSCSLILLYFTAGAQCGYPASNSDFQAAFNQIAIQQVPQNKLTKAVEFVNSNCVTAAQARTLAQLFGNDNDRFTFCRSAYPRIYDRQNYYEVYDAFTSYANVIRLHDFVLGWAPGNAPISEPPTVTPPVVTPPAPKPVTFPKWAYPVSANYTGTKGCTGPVASPEDFNALASSLTSQPTDESKQVAIQNAANEQCLDLEQAMKLVSMIKSESVRMNTLTTVFPSLYDPEHYASAAAAFPTAAMKSKWTSYASEYLMPPPPPCNVSDADFKAALNTLKAKHFSDERLSVVDVLAKDKCFSTEQVRGISQTAPFGEEKIAMFKKLYPKCTDKSNYYKLVDELKFTHEQQEMNDFIKKN